MRFGSGDQIGAVWFFGDCEGCASSAERGRDFAARDRQASVRSGTSPSEFEWGAAKAEPNFEKLGVTFAEAVTVLAVVMEVAADHAEGLRRTVEF